MIISSLLLIDLLISLSIDSMAYVEWTEIVEQIIDFLNEVFEGVKESLEHTLNDI